MKNKMQALLILFTTSLLFSLSIYSADISEAQEKLLENLPPDQRASLISKMETKNNLDDEIDEAIEEEKLLIERPDLTRDDLKEEICNSCIYGYDFFRFSPSTFAPANKIPATDSYILGPGDKVDIRIYGSQNIKIKEQINRDGTINIPKIGPVFLAGLTYAEAKDALDEMVTRQLSGAESSINLVELRSISVFLLGQAYLPGAYTVSALSSITNALFVAGGVNEQGSLRNIEVRRNGEIIAVYDFYDFLLKGNTDSDLKLQDGDVIFIPFIQNTVTLGGFFKKPYLYEFREAESIKDLIELAGGYDRRVPASATLEIDSYSIENNSRSLIRVPLKSDLLNSMLTNGDRINVNSSSSSLSQSMTLDGEVEFPGEYSIFPGDTLLDIINRAGGYTNSSYSEGAVFLRKEVAEIEKKGFQRAANSLEENLISIISSGDVSINSEYSLAPITTLIKRLREFEPVGRQVVEVDLLTLKTDPLKNLQVRDGDKLYIPKRPDSVSVMGEVLNPSTLRFEPSTSIQDYILKSGGMKQEADDSRIFVILPNGEGTVAKRKFFSKGNAILPGSTIIVPRSARPYDAIKLTQIITPILADLATSAAAIAAISD
jgi:protein involved in polysaccharide export with SLBB domain